MREALSILIVVVGLCLGAYLGLYLGLLEGIKSCLNANSDRSLAFGIIHVLFGPPIGFGIGSMVILFGASMVKGVDSHDF